MHEQWGHLAESVQVKYCQLVPLQYGVHLLTSCCLQYLLHLNMSDVHVELDTVTQQIREAGAMVSSYIPDNTLLVVAQPEKLEALKQVAGVSASLS